MWQVLLIERFFFLVFNVITDWNLLFLQELAVHLSTLFGRVRTDKMRDIVELRLGQKDPLDSVGQVQLLDNIWVDVHIRLTLSLPFVAAVLSLLLFRGVLIKLLLTMQSLTVWINVIWQPLVHLSSRSILVFNSTTIGFTRRVMYMNILKMLLWSHSILLALARFWLNVLVIQRISSNFISKNLAVITNNTTEIVSVVYMIPGISFQLISNMRLIDFVCSFSLLLARFIHLDIFVLLMHLRLVCVFVSLLLNINTFSNSDLNLLHLFITALVVFHLLRMLCIITLEIYIVFVLF